MGRYQGTSGAAYEGMDGADIQRVSAPRVPALGRGQCRVYTVFRVHSSARVDCPFSIIAAPTVAAMPAQGYGAPQGPDDGTQWAPYELQTPTLVYQHESDDLWRDWPCTSVMRD